MTNQVEVTVLGRTFTFSEAQWERYQYLKTNPERYQYHGRIYSEYDFRDKLNNYGGDLFDLYFNLKADGKISDSMDSHYDSPEALIDNEFEYLEVKYC